jgi:hypothetical protein
MSLTGGCYCGAVRYAAERPVLFRGQCLCRTCQRISGGGGNLFIVVDADGFKFTEGKPREFVRTDRPEGPTRAFCGACGVHLTARSPKAAGVVLIKVGTLDDPSVFGAPEVVTWTDEKQSFHQLPAGVPAYGGFRTAAR